MNHHIGHISSHLSPPISLRRTVLISRSSALAWSELVVLSPLVRGRVGVSCGYNLCFGQVEAPNAPPVHYLSFGQDLEQGLYFLTESVTRTLVGV